MVGKKGRERKRESVARQGRRGEGRHAVRQAGERERVEYHTLAIASFDLPQIADVGRQIEAHKRRQKSTAHVAKQEKNATALAMELFTAQEVFP